MSDRDELAGLICATTGFTARDGCMEIAERILASDWLAEHDRALLRAVADEIEAERLDDDDSFCCDIALMKAAEICRARVSTGNPNTKEGDE